jgi:hypothetical protein
MNLADEQPSLAQSVGSTGAVSVNDVSPEQAQARLDALTVLQNALADFRSREGRAPTASELRLEMGRLSRGGFKVKALGYRRFRDLVADAEAQGLVSVDANRQGDIAVNPPSATRADVDTPFLRPDLWKAIVDWDPAMTRVWDTESRRAMIFPTEPVLLEPEKYQKVRSELASDPKRFVSIPHLTISDQLELLRQFSDSLNLDPVTRTLVGQGFETKRPMKNVLDILKDYEPDAAVGWTAVLRARANAYAEQWKKSSPALADISLIARVDEPASHQARRASGERFNESVKEASDVSESRSTPVEHLLIDENALRYLIHRAVDRMPLHELQALRIPLGYLLKEG